MVNPTAIVDIESRWRPLSSAESINAQAFLDDAWTMLKRSMSKRGYSTFEADVLADDDLKADVVRIECQMALRVLKNPDGMRQTSLSIDDGSRTWTRDNALSTGLLYVSDEELDELSPGGSSEAFTVRPVATPYYGPSADYPAWSLVNPYGSIC